MKYSKQLYFLGFFLSFIACNKTSIKEQTLTISGSTTIGEQLMPQLVKAFFIHEGIQLDTSLKNGDSYICTGKRRDTVFTVQIQSIGSTKGLNMLENGQTSIAMISEMQLIKAEQFAEYDTLELAHDSIVLIAHRHNPVQQLTVDQIKDIFTGTTKTWETLTPQYPFSINVHIRDTASGTSEVFKHLVLDNLAYSSLAKRHNSNSHLFDDIKLDYYGIGYTSSSELTNNEDFKPITIVHSTNKSFNRPLFLLFKKDKNPNLSTAFRQFCRSETAKLIIAGQNFKI
jgi:phosphate transport system substrate-binding protein